MFFSLFFSEIISDTSFKYVKFSKLSWTEITSQIKENERNQQLHNMNMSDQPSNISHAISSHELEIV